MLRILHPFACAPRRANLPLTESFLSPPPFSTVNPSAHSGERRSSVIYTVRASKRQGSSSNRNLQREEGGHDFHEQEDEEGEEGEFSSWDGFTGREDERNYDKDPEFAEILGSCLDDPQKARSKVSSKSSYLFILTKSVSVFSCWVLLLSNDCVSCPLASVCFKSFV